MFEVKKDCNHCIRLRIRNNKCVFYGKIIEDIYNHTCKEWKEDTWMTEREKKEYDERLSLNEDKIE